MPLGPMRVVADGIGGRAGKNGDGFLKNFQRPGACGEESSLFAENLSRFGVNNYCLNVLPSYLGVLIEGSPGESTNTLLDFRHFLRSTDCGGRF